LTYSSEKVLAGRDADIKELDFVFGGFSSVNLTDDATVLGFVGSTDSALI
jgi:hypothetical protein